jgi:hypothetical protein
LRYIEFLVDSGTPVDTTTRQGQTALDILCTVMGPQEERSRLVHYLKGHGSYIFDLSKVSSGRCRRALQDILSEDEDGKPLLVLYPLLMLTQIKVAVFPEIAKIILREHDSALREALNSGLANVNDTTQSLTLLEISIGWPKDLQILLEAGADISRYLKGPHDPISRAICLPCRNSLNVLLKAGCNIRTYQLYDDYDLCAKSPEIVLDIVEGLAARRKRLRDLVRCHLPLQQLPSLMPSNTLPDTTAAGLIDDLIARRVAVDSALWVEFPGRSVYHAEYSTKSNPWKLSWKLPYLGVDTMEALYKVGFHDIDATDSSGRTPLMTIPSNSWASVPTIRWFISKGANLFRILPRSHATVFHYLACLLVCGMPVLKSEYNPLSYYIIHAPIQDNCVCGCCSEGYTPLSMALRRVLQPDWQGPKCLEFMIPPTDLAPGAAKSIIRSVTFDRFELTHTCCCLHEDDGLFVIEDRDLEEIREIREEEQASLGRFEGLVEELNAKFDGLGLPILDFLQQYLHPRITEFLSQRDLYDEDHIIGANQLGVQLTLDNDEDDGFYDRCPCA